MRAIAILSVVFSHTFEFLLPLKSIPFVGFLVENFFKFTQPLGALGVELFFVLSGFLIGTILIKTFVESPQFSVSDIRVFLIRRWFRTLPNYWLILTVDILLYALLSIGSVESYKFLFYIFAQNLWYPHPPFFFGEAWSLAVEEWFYLLLPFSIYIPYLVFKPVNKQRFLFKILVAFITVFVLLRFFNAFHPINGPDQDAGIRKVVFLRLDALAYGVMIAYFVYFKRPVINRIRKQLFAIGIIGTICIYYLISNEGLAVCNTDNPTLKFFSDAFLYLILPINFSLLLPYANSIASISNASFKNVIQFVSRISYSIYLVHYSLVYIPFFYQMKIENPLLLFFVYISYWTIVLLLSFLLYRYFENPLMKKRDKYAIQK
ncbi:acyltransferase family protein [Taibaiella lutea]|uniref:acyltransferase family protein n=1 Tax=Taibaiella lutea TaxID=2608001 RepID=UPI00167FE18A|nr:acyltransferase [Taibaiella lutea]